jgi:hypothetical protein
MGGSYTSTLPFTFMTCMGTTLPLSVLNLGMKIVPFSLEVSLYFPVSYSGNMETSNFELRVTTAVVCRDCSFALIIHMFRRYATYVCMIFVSR